MASRSGTGDRGIIACAGWCAKGQAAFTLLELVLVLLVAGLLLAVAVPSLRPFARGREAKQTAGELVAMTRLARSLAVSEGRAYRLHVDLEAHALWLSHEELALDEAVPVPIARSIVLPAEVELFWEADAEVMQQGYVRFEPNGRWDAGVFEVVGRVGEPVVVAARSPMERYAVRDVDVVEGRRDGW